MAIAKMLGCIDSEGDFVLPIGIGSNNYSEYADSKNVHHPEIYEGCYISHYINVDFEIFAYDYNWQHYAIEWMEKEFDIHFSITTYWVKVDINPSSKVFIFPVNIPHSQKKGDIGKKEAILEALYQFNLQISKKP